MSQLHSWYLKYLKKFPQVPQTSAPSAPDECPKCPRRVPQVLQNSAPSAPVPQTSAPSAPDECPKCPRRVPQVPQNSAPSAPVPQQCNRVVCPGTACMVALCCPNIPAVIATGSSAAVLAVYSSSGGGVWTGDALHYLEVIPERAVWTLRSGQGVRFRAIIADKLLPSLLREIIHDLKSHFKKRRTVDN